MDSDSDDERAAGYVPVLAATLSSAARSVNSPHRPDSAIPKDGVSLYTNELFTDGDVLSEGPSVTSPNGTVLAARRGPSLAARRQERLQAGTITTPNTFMKSSSLRGPQAGSSPSMKGMTDSPSFRPSNLSQTGGSIPETTTTPSSSQGGVGLIHGMRPYYDPNEGNEEAVSTVRVQERQVAAPARSLPQLDLSDMPKFLMQPGPKTGPVQCIIVRDRGSTKKMYPRYSLFLEDGRKFMLSARKRKKQTTSNYIISMDFQDLSRESGSFFGKVRANFVGTEFTIYDNGLKPGKKEGAPDQDRLELGAVTYQYNVLGTRGPRKMMAAIPAVDGSGRRLFEASGEGDCILERLKHRKGLDELVVMGNKPPRWNDELNAYCLNFNGRVTEASVKNFQLVSDDNQNHIILQFGKVGKDTFTMDFQWPISAFQAFAFCLSSFDNKLACE